MQTILLTGGTGYIGSHIAVELLQNGYQIVIVDNLSNSHDTVVSIIEKISGKKVKFYRCDINNCNHLDQVFQENTIDVVIHLAGHKSVAESITDPLKYYDNNVGGLITLLKCMENHLVKRIIFSSSATVYGNPETLPITEDSKINILNPYGSTKLMSENILRDIPGLSVIILRYFNPVGAHSSGLLNENPRIRATNLFPIITSIYEGQKEYLEVFGSDYSTDDGSPIRDYIHVIDLAYGHVKSLDYILQNNVKCEIFNLGTGRGYSVLEIIKGFEKHSGKKLPFLLKERRNGDSETIYADCQKANNILGWLPKYNLDDMICSTLNKCHKTTSLNDCDNNIVYTSALYNIYGNPKFSEILSKNVEWLLSSNLKIFLYVDEFFYKITQNLKISDNITIILKPLSNLIIYNKIMLTDQLQLPGYRNIDKDTKEYMALMNNKIEFIKYTKDIVKTRYVTWIDAGITKMFKNRDNCFNKLKNLNIEKLTNILQPGCYERNLTFEQLNNNVWWCFLGCFFICNVNVIEDFYEKSLISIDKFMSKNKITWEVNIWIDISQNNPKLFTKYYADHNDSLTEIPNEYKI